MALSTAVLFDIDGTLVDSTYHHALSWHRSLARHGVEVPLWRVHRSIGMGGDRLVAHVAGDDVEERLGDRLRESWEEEYRRLLDEVPALPCAARLVCEVAEAGHAAALASSGKREFSEAAVELLGIGDAVAVLTSADDADASKPAPDLLTSTLDRLGGPAAVLVGDTPYDVEAARRAGIGCVAVLTGGFSRAELEEAGADLVVEGAGDLLGADWTRYLRAAP